MISLPTIGQMLSTHARLTPNRLAARDLTRDMNYALWNERACKLANGLLALGLSKGDRIVVLAYNRLEWVEIYVKSPKIFSIETFSQYMYLLGVFKFLASF